MTSSIPRNQAVDFIKGMLMLGIIYGHAVDALCGGLSHSPVWLHVFVRTFDLPFFMCISGYFLKVSIARKSLLRIALDRITMLMAPLLVWTLLSCQLNVFGWMYYFIWAVLVSCAICLLVKKISIYLPYPLGSQFEAVTLMIVIVVMHIVNVPWNIPYLFPFFVFGYYLKNLDLKFSLWSNAVLVLLFVLGLCFWSPRYSPWNITHLAWKNDPFVIFIYAYRTALGVLGICVMGNFLKCLRTSLGEGSKFSKLMTDGGARDTWTLHVACNAIGCDYA